jgi:tRNA pseudouridine13 synthase
VEDPDVEQPRADAFEISPTGPLAGGRCRLAEGSPGELERSILASHGLDNDDTNRVSFFEPPGARRALRFPIEDVELQSGTDTHGPFLQVSFFAPSGAYATVVLQEIIKG